METAQQVKLACILVLLVLSGCTRSSDDLVAKVESIKQERGDPLDPIPVMQTFETFSYAADNLRDPFTPSVDEEGAGGSGPRPDPNRARETLESFPLDTLDMVGTIGVTKSLMALIKDPDGVVHRVQAGKYLGQNYGQATQVFEDRVELVELISNGSGGWTERPASIALDEE